MYNKDINEESISSDTGEINTPKAFEKTEAVTGAVSDKKSKKYIPKAFEFPKFLLGPIEGKKHFKIVSNNSQENLLCVSQEAKSALDSVERGRTSFDKEEKLPSLTRYLKEKLPSSISGLIKKSIGNSRTNDNFFVTSLKLSHKNPNDEHSGDKKIDITDKGINVLRQVKANPEGSKMSDDVLQLLIFLYKQRGQNVTVKDFVQSSGNPIQGVSRIVNSMPDYIKSIDLEQPKSGDRWFILNPWTFGNEKDLNNPLYEMIKEEMLKESHYNQFKKDVTYRTKSEQLHKAIREVKRKIQEIDRIVEYTTRMKQELSEGEEGIKYWKATQKNVATISEMVNRLNNKLKNLHE